MPRLSAIDAVAPAIERTKAMLLRPFRFKSWMVMGMIGWLAGEGTGASFNFTFPGTPPWSGKPAPTPNPSGSHFPISTIIILISAVVLVAAAIGVAFLYLFSRFRFVLFDCVLSGQIGIERGWKIFRNQAHRFFWLWLWAGLAFLAFVVAAIGIPVLIAYRRGAFEHGPPSPEVIFAYFGIIFVAFIGLALVTFVLTTLAKDFFVPLMALDDLSVGEAWRAMKQILSAEPGSFAAYFGLKLVLSFVVAFLMAIPMFILFFAVLIIGIVGAVVIALVVHNPSPLLIGAGIVFGVIALVLLVATSLALMVFLSAPAAVFFTSYALLFFGGRYPKLGELFWPAPVSPIPPPPPPLISPAPAI